MTNEHDVDFAQQLGALNAQMNTTSERIVALDGKIDLHIKDEETRLKHIEEQLSLGRFMWLTVKAVVLTLVFILAWKFGDIKGLWAELK